MPDTAPTLAVVAAVVDGTTRISGLSTLRHKETDRIGALENELRKLGIEVKTGEDWIKVIGGKISPAEIDPHGDHRMAMSFAILKAVCPEIEILNPGVVDKSFPNFWETLDLVSR